MAASSVMAQVAVSAFAGKLNGIVFSTGLRPYYVVRAIPTRDPTDLGLTMLEGVNLFEGLSEDDRETIERHAVTRRYRKSTVIIEQGDAANSLYILRAGRVKVFASNGQGREIIFNEQGEGAVLGELALLAGIPRTASVMTLVDSEFLVLSRQAFDDCLADHPEITLNLVRYLALRVQQLTESVSDFALMDVYGRIAKLLQETATTEGDRTITPKLTHQQIADFVGASREMVSKILKDLKVGGYVDVEGKRYILLRKLPVHW